jgi:hypothetical protein
MKETAQTNVTKLIAQAAVGFSAGNFVLILIQILLVLELRYYLID